jgi:tRNA threonylcarbamoyladenosine biosynthesis protein TsaB
VCVADDRGPRACIWVTGGRRHAETLAPAVTQALELAGVELGDLSAIAVDVGPGLFTGLRVGVATAKGLAQGLRVGLIGLGSLRLLGSAARDAGCQTTVTAVIDARRSEVFTAEYRPVAAPAGGNGLAGPVSLSALSGVEEIAAPRVMRPEALADELAQRAPGCPTLVVGDGARRYGDLFGPIAGVSVAGASLAAPPPATLATLGVGWLASGHDAPDPSAVVPDYQRGPDARINWHQRSRAPVATLEPGEAVGSIPPP